MRLLFESAENVKTAIHDFLTITEARDWDTVHLIESLLKQYAVSRIDVDIEIVKAAYEEVLEGFTKRADLPAKATEARRRIIAIKQIMDNPIVRKLFSKQLCESTEAEAVQNATCNMLSQAGKHVAQKQQEREAGSSKQQKPSKYSLRSNPAQSKPAVATPQETPLKELGPEDAMQRMLKSKVCRNGVIDFTKSITARFRPALPKITKHYKFLLEAAVTLEERRVLMNLSRCKTLGDEEQLIQSLFSNSSQSENVKYLRTAINCLFDIWRSKRLEARNDEGWLRSNVYSNIWDRAFLFDDYFYVKRAECYSAVIKKLKEQDPTITQQRVDFILRSNQNGTDFLMLEEKPRDSNVLYDLEKGKQMQRHMLQLWSNWLGSKLLVSQLEALTCQFEERKLTVFATRMLPSGEFLVYTKATALIPTSASHYAAAARVLLVILSIKRLVTLNYMKLTTMIEAYEEYATRNLDLSISTDQSFITYHQDSSGSIDANCSQESSDDPDHEHIAQAYQKCLRIQHPDDVLSSINWEQLLIDDTVSSRESEEASSSSTNKRQKC
ncbi:hypothetical protein BJV82DRAFT_629506 [Fennellomyces sp. T-0311]|nr:hypothetical protein BJV82DRAFT_629506 [Fennellomyces sp. T-0311]